MIFIVSSFLVRQGFNGITIWPFVIARNKHLKEDPVFINHEKIHLRQQLEMLVLPFYVWYTLEYLLRLLQYRNRHTAYRNISFEREAYAKENDLNYLKRRSFFGFLEYVKFLFSWVGESFVFFSTEEVFFSFKF